MSKVICIAIVIAKILLGATDQKSPEAMRKIAWEALQSRVKDQKVLNHSLAVEAIMREMAGHNDDPDEWGLAGLLHDIDIATTHDDLSHHGVVGAQILRDLGFSNAVVHAVSAHDDHAGIARESRMDHALYCADQVYWLVVGAGFRFPEDVRNTETETIWSRIQESRERSKIATKVSAECSQIGFDMPQLVAAAKRAAKSGR